jgi:uncharacterized protein
MTRPELFSLAAAVHLTGQSERTIRRRIAGGLLTKIPDVAGDNRTMINFIDIAEQLIVPFSDEELQIVKNADLGDADAQNDTGLVFLAKSRLESAVAWFELAAKQGHPDAMHWLGKCYLEGNGVARNDDLGLMWIAKAAAAGHAIAQAQTEALRTAFTGYGPGQRNRE